MPFLHLFNLDFKLANSLEVLAIHLVQPVYIPNCFLKLVFESEIVAHDVADPSVLNLIALVHLELVEKQTRFMVEQALSLQILLIVVHFELALLQQVLFSVKLVLNHFRLLLIVRPLGILLVFHILDDLSEDQLLSV